MQDTSIMTNISLRDRSNRKLFLYFDELQIKVIDILDLNNFYEDFDTLVQQIITMLHASSKLLSND